MHCYPVYFSAIGPVTTKGFDAISYVSGRMLIDIGENDATEIWIASPSGVYVQAGSLGGAVTEAVDRLGRGLSVLAQDSCDYAEFDMRAKRLLEHPIDSLEERWAEACSLSAKLPNRPEFVGLAEAPEIRIVNVLMRERLPEVIPMTQGPLQIERRAA